MRSIAIITARGGSKRIPKKNIKAFCGRPIIAYSIKAAIQSKQFDTVMVSTDSSEIAEIAKEYGAEVPFLRSEATSNDYATTADVLNEVLDEYEKKSITFDTMCCIYPTAPFVTGEKLKKAVARMNETGADGIMPVVRFSFPPQRGLIMQDSFLRFQYPEYEKSRSQDLEPMYHDCGQFYLCKVDAFRKHNTVVCPNTTALIMPDEEVQDIDTLSDWVLAEVKYRTFILKEQG